MVDCGYETAEPDTSKDYGYGDAAPDSGQYGYREGHGDRASDDDDNGAPDSAPGDVHGDVHVPAPVMDVDVTEYGYGYGYGDADAAPDSSDDPYGYGDAEPDSAVADKYGYGDAAPDGSDDPYGYGEAEPDSAVADKYGYGDAAPDSSDDPYGYGDAMPDSDVAFTPQQQQPPRGGGGGEYQMGYNDNDAHMQSDRRDQFRKNPRTLSEDSTMSAASHHSVATAESYGEYYDNDESNSGGNGGDQLSIDLNKPRRQRYRRRGSITKYSLDAQVEVVQQQYDAHSNVIHTLRTGGTTWDAAAAAAPDAAAAAEAVDSFATSTSISTIDDGVVLSAAPTAAAGKRKKKKGKMGRFRRFTMGV